MCKWAARNLRTSQCNNYNQEDPNSVPHEYQELQIWPCEDAERISTSPVVWKTCENFVGKGGRVGGSDIGTTRNIPCPVCKKQAEAQEIYDREIKDAWNKYQESINRSTEFTRYVSLLGMDLMLWDDADDEMHKHKQRDA